jgi:hypothetical protein
MTLEPVSVSCPACWQTVELDIDPALGDQQFVEDCQVCCRPMQVEVTVWDGEVQVDVSSAND